MTIILYLSSIPTDGGKFQYSLSILHALKLFDNSENRLIIFYNNNYWKEYCENISIHNNYIKQNFIVKVIKKTVLKLPYGLKLWRFLSKFVDHQYKMMNECQPDFVFFPGNDSLAYEYDLPSVIPVFDLMHLYEPSFPEVSGIIAKKRNYHYSKISEYSKIILVDSEVGREQLVASFNTKKEKIFVLPYVPPNYIYDSVDADKVLAKFKLPDKYIFYPAQFWAHKNHINLLNAIAILNRRNLVVNAVFVGAEKNLFSKVKDKIKELNLSDQVKILNYVTNEELVSLYKKAYSLVMPTFFGPTNIPPLEAFTLGCPVITSNIYGVPAQVEDAALLFDPKNSEDIANRIELIYTNDKLRIELITKGKLLSKIYTINNNSLKIKEILTSVIG